MVHYRYFFHSVHTLQLQVSAAIDRAVSRYLKVHFPMRKPPSCLRIVPPPFHTTRTQPLLHPSIQPDGCFPWRPLYPTNILPRNGVPRRHVLLHALREARFFLTGQRAAGGGDAFFEAVHVEFLSGLSAGGFKAVDG